jgi:hypothetical protein
MNQERYNILGNELIMYPDGAGVRGEVIVNGIVYRVHQNVSWGAVRINDKVISPTYPNFAFGVSSVIAKLQNYTAWQQAKLGIWDFETVMNSAKRYRVCDVVFYVYRSVDATCWQYDTGDEGEDGQQDQHYSPWYSSEIQPTADHFKAWIISTIGVSS